MAAFEKSVLQVAYQETRELMTLFKGLSQPSYLWRKTLVCHHLPGNLSNQKSFGGY